MIMWKTLILSYAKSLKKWSLTFNELYESPICQNASINRRLKMDSIKQIAKWMVQNKFAAYTSAEGGDVEPDKIFVYWLSPSDIGSAIFEWAKDTGKIGSIETVIDIIEDEFSTDKIFHNIPIEIALNALYMLQDEGKS